MTIEEIKRALAEHGSKTAAAQALGIPRSTLTEFALANWKFIVIAALAAALIVVANAYVDLRDEFVGYKASVAVLAESAEREVEKKEQEGRENLAKVRGDYENKIETIRSNAVANYTARREPVRPASSVRNANAGSGSVSGSGSGLRLDDGASKECVVAQPDAAFIEDAADDAAKLSAWQEYARLNGIEVKE